MLHARWTSIALLLGASACSGHAGIPPVPEGAGTTPAYAQTIASAAGAARTRVRFRIAVPGRTRSSAPHRILPAYVSASTQKASFVVQGQNESKPEAPQVFACTSVCTGMVNVPVGVDRIFLTLKDKHGRGLSRGDTSVLIFQKNNNVLQFTLDGIVAKVGLVAVPATLPVVPASNGYLLFEARDADGNIIMPNGQYVDASGKALVFDVATSSTALKLGAKTVSAPGSPIPFTYDGSLHLGKVTLTPSAHPGTTTAAKLLPATIKLVPGIAQRLAPPVPITALAVTQVRFQGSSPASDSYLIAGNTPGNWAILAFNRDSAAYTMLASGPGAFEGVPLDNTPVAGESAANEFTGFTRDSSGTYSTRTVTEDGVAVPNTGNPCSSAGQTPLADMPLYPSASYCQTADSTGNSLVLDASGAVEGSGVARKIEGFMWQANGAPVYHAYLVTTAGVYEDSDGADALPGATTVGRSRGWYLSGSKPYIGYANGAVFLGGTRVAKFSHGIQSLTGDENPGGEIYAFEQGGTFGVHTNSGTFETATLPVGTIVDIIPAYDYPVLVESDGTLDVMGI